MIFLGFLKKEMLKNSELFDLFDNYLDFDVYVLLLEGILLGVIYG